MRKPTILFLAALLLLFSCTDGGTGRVIDRAEQLLDSCPEQAVAMLDSILPTAMRQNIARRSRFVLLRQKAKHMAWMPLDVDTTLMEAVIWTDRNGTPNERLMANYLLGYGYAEHGWTSEGQQAYFRAIEAADTTAKDCDFSRLAKTYAQKSILYLNRTHPELMLEDAKKAKHYSLLAGDSLMALISEAQIGFIYNYVGDRRSALQIFKKVFDAFLSNGDTVWAANEARHIAKVLINLDNLDEAIKYIQFYEKHFISTDRDRVEDIQNGYYSLKGKFFEKSNQIDSALYYYRKDISKVDVAHDIGAYEDLYKF